MIVTLYGLHIGGEWNEGYLDSVHPEYDAFRFSKTKEDTIITLLVSESIADKLLKDDDFADGYERYRFVSNHIQSGLEGGITNKGENEGS